MKYFFLVLLLLLSSCAHDGTELWNGCVIVASNRKAVEDAAHDLDPSYESGFYMVHYKGAQQGHCYFVWKINRTIFAYDEGGARDLGGQVVWGAASIGYWLAGDKYDFGYFIIAKGSRSATF